MRVHTLPHGRVGSMAPGDIWMVGHWGIVSGCPSVLSEIPQSREIDHLQLASFLGRTCLQEPGNRHRSPIELLPNNPKASTMCGSPRYRQATTEETPLRELWRETLDRR